jgi:pimeloyl-ACP methyl ester carboxylesterase
MWGVRELPELNRPIETAALQRLTMPVLLLEGTRSSDHFKATLRLLREALNHAHVVNVMGAGHLVR